MNNINTILYISPERLDNPTRAFIKRQLQVVHALSDMDSVQLDVLCFDQSKGQPLLDIDSRYKIHKTHIVHANQGKFTWCMRWRRRLENRLKSIVQGGDKSPKTFVERTYMWTNRASIVKALEIIDRHKYKAVVIAGAWAYARLKEVANEESIQLPEVIVDLHDLFFRLDDHLNQGQFRSLYSYANQKKRELDLLASARLNITISTNDKQQLNQLGIENTVNYSGYFDYISSDIQRSRAEGVLKYGYIASSNLANYNAALRMLRTWWPRIYAMNPSACLHIAGDIANHPKLEPYIDERFNVFKDGYVYNLSDWYTSLNALLVPNELPGGLIFKGVEALLHGVPIIVNTNSISCFNDMEGIGVEAWTGTCALERANKYDPIQIRDKAQSIFMNLKHRQSFQNQIRNICHD